MRRKLQLDLDSLDKFSMLIHGDYGVGKTHLLGDMLQTEQAVGPVKLVSVAGEDGCTTLGLKGFEAFAEPETVEDMKDLRELLRECKDKKTHALGLDGFRRVFRLIIRETLGELRLPRTGSNTNEWGPVHFAYETFVEETLKSAADIVVCTIGSDRSMNQIVKETWLTPDLPGRQATGTGGMFDFVFVMSATVTGPNKMSRKLMTAPTSNVLIRARLPEQLPTEIVIPNGPGGWACLYKAIQDTFKKGKTT